MGREHVIIDHELKSWVGLFQPIYDGHKTHDLRVMDRKYAVGNVCLLREWNPTEKFYTGRSVLIEVTYITSSQHTPCAFSPYALHEAMCCLSIRRIVLRRKMFAITSENNPLGYIQGRDQAEALSLAFEKWPDHPFIKAEEFGGVL